MIFRLDRSHIRQEIKRKLNKGREAARRAEELFEAEKTEEMPEHILTYAESADTGEEGDGRAEKARELWQYLDSNREGLPPYQKRGIKLPEPPEGMRKGSYSTYACQRPSQP